MKRETLIFSVGVVGILKVTQAEKYLPIYLSM